MVRNLAAEAHDLASTNWLIVLSMERVQILSLSVFILRGAGNRLVLSSCSVYHHFHHFGAHQKCHYDTIKKRESSLIYLMRS